MGSTSREFQRNGDAIESSRAAQKRVGRTVLVAVTVLGRAEWCSSPTTSHLFREDGRALAQDETPLDERRGHSHESAAMLDRLGADRQQFHGSCCATATGD